MPGAEAIFYRSSNGDQWSLRQEPGADRLSIRHQPNRASGGRPAILEVSDFLAEGHGPQHEALLRLLEDRADKRAEGAERAITVDAAKR
jgi:hypothetical protein